MLNVNSQAMTAFLPVSISGIPAWNIWQARCQPEWLTTQLCCYGTMCEWTSEWNELAIEPILSLLLLSCITCLSKTYTIYSVLGYITHARLYFTYVTHCVCICVYRHQEAVHTLLTELMHKFQFRYNQSELDALDYETVDSDTVRRKFCLSRFS